MMKPKYTPTDEKLAQINESFTYHAPKGDQVQRYEAIREAFREFAIELVGQAPPCRELDIAIEHLESSAMWINKAIACGESEG